MVFWLLKDSFQIIIFGALCSLLNGKVVCVMVWVFWFRYPMFPVLFCSYNLMCLVVTFHFLSLSFFSRPLFFCVHPCNMCWLLLCITACVFPSFFASSSVVVLVSVLQLLGSCAGSFFPYPRVSSVSLLCSRRLLVYPLIWKPFCIPLLSTLLPVLHGLWFYRSHFWIVDVKLTFCLQQRKEWQEFPAEQIKNKKKPKIKYSHVLPVTPLPSIC